MQRLTEALSARTDPLSLFFRDDDAGWAQDRLDAMLEVFATLDVPVDLAVIPAVLTPDRARDLDRWRQRHSGIGLHQHGYAHLNHEPEGRRKCEFGDARPQARQAADIMIGRKRLSAMLGQTDPIFTPPWNRCADGTITCLSTLGFAAYSDDGKATQTGEGPNHLPIDLDWERCRREDRLVGALAALLAAPRQRAGIMLHHATMDDDAIVELATITRALRAHPRIRCAKMRDLLENPS